MRRLSQFLVMEERTDDVEQLPAPGARIRGGSFLWAEPPAAVVRPKRHCSFRSPQKLQQRLLLRRHSPTGCFNCCGRGTGGRA